MSRGRGSGKQGGLQGAIKGLTQAQGQSQGGTTGPQGGRATGRRDGGAPEDTTFKREKVSAQGINPRGQAVGSFVADGPSPEGEAKLEVGPPVEQAVQELSEEVEKEPLPVEHRRQVERFYDLLLQGATKPQGE